MDRLGFFKQGLSSMMEAAQSVIGLKKAADTLTEVVEEALSGIAPDIGLHLPSLDAMMYDSPSGTLYEVGQMGYTMVEAGCYYSGTVYGVKAEELLSQARSSGLKIAGLYLNKFYEKNELEISEAENSEAVSSESASSEQSQEQTKSILKEEDLAWWNRAIECAVAMKCRYITTPSYPIESNEETINDYAQYFSTVGAMVAEKGMQFCFHPSRRELTQDNEKSILDRIAEATAQENVSFQIDTLEATKAGVDICALIKQYGKRIVSLHLHDVDITCESERIDFDNIIRQAEECGVKDIFIEVSSFPLPPHNCVDRSLRNVEMLDSVRF